MFKYPHVSSHMEQVQIVEKREKEDQYIDIREVLVKGKDYVRHHTWTYNGICEGYRMLKMLSPNLLEVYEYHHCPYAYEDLPLYDDEELEELDEAKWAHVEVEDASKIMAINSIEEFDKVYGSLYECIREQNGWEKTVKCTF
jgi:hypothetical protein